MPDLIRVRKNPARRIGAWAFHLFDLAAYEFLYRLSPARKLKFFNGGYLPLAADMADMSGFPGEEPSVMMYHLVARTLPGDLNPPPAKILDVGCGQGGGLSYLSLLFPEAALTGTERNGTAARLARRLYAQNPKLRFVKATGDRIAFPDRSFDMVISVGAPTYFGLPRFVEQAGRVLAPGGVLSFSGGYRQGSHAEIERELRQSARDQGLEFLAYRDITPNTFQSLKADIPRRLALLKKVPWPFRLYGNKWADLPGSAEYEEYETGKRADFAALMRKAPDLSETR